VAGLTPRLRSHAEIHRHRYRGETWYVLEDPSTGRFHRFSPAAYLIIGLMDGRRTVQEIWEIATARLGDDAPVQDEIIQVLSQLHAVDVLQCDVTPDAAEVLERHERQIQRAWMSRLMNPFAWRVPLFDPERLLRMFAPVVRPFVGWCGALVWLAVVVPAIVLAGVHWPELSRDVVNRLFSPQSVALLWLSYPVIKLLHEFGHAFVTKVFGGEVHEMGVMLLVLTPVPYVDASAASAFRNKWQRIAVGAAGMLVELFIAALALFVWLSAQPGTVRILAYNAMIIAGLSTVIFNANPLLRYDGYYMLSDFLEIPNLRSRANAYVGYLCERYLFGRRDAEAPPAAHGERAWFVSYFMVSIVYRALVVVGILIFLADRFFLLAVIFAALGLIAWAAVPGAKSLAFLFTSPRLRSVRARAIVVTAMAVGVLASAVCLVPAPFRSEAEGVVWIPDEAFVRAGTEGFIERIVATPGSRVGPGDVLFRLRDPVLAARVGELAARRRELEARYAEQQPTDRVKAEIVKEQLVLVTESLGRAREREAGLTIRSRAAGTFVVAVPDDLPGRFVRQGELLAHVVDLGTITVRAVVLQTDIDLVLRRTRGVDVRLAERLAESIPAGIARIVPGASERLPNAALGSEGGGRITIDPRDRQGVAAVQKFFEIDVELQGQPRLLNVGGRAYVRFHHGWAPLAVQWYQEVRQLFLSRFNV